MTAVGPPDWPMTALPRMRSSMGDGRAGLSGATGVPAPGGSPVLPERPALGALEAFGGGGKVAQVVLADAAAAVADAAAGAPEADVFGHTPEREEQQGRGREGAGVFEDGGDDHALVDGVAAGDEGGFGGG